MQVTQQQVFETLGEVTESLPNNMYRVKIKGDRMLLCKIIYRMTKRRIKVVPGDTVTVKIIPPDLVRGRIVYRGTRQPRDQQQSKPRFGGGAPQRRRRR